MTSPFALIRVALTCGLLTVCTLACQQAGLPDNPGAKMPAEDKIIEAIDTRARSAAMAEALPNSMSQSITGIVSLADGVSAPEGTLFVYARKPGVTSGPPVAVARFDASSFPVRFELSKANVMIPKAPFEGPLVLSARLDTDGNAMTRSEGDLSGQSAEAVQIGAANVPIVLGGALPSAGASAPAKAAPVNPHAAGGMSTGGGPSAKASASAGGAISGRIELAEGATAKEGVIFLMARQKGVKRGPPLAVKRLDIGTFPLAFELTSANVMMPGMSLEGEVDVSARLDVDGDAMSKGPDDLVGETTKPVTLGTSGVVITLGPR